jgi:hypothetical protein
VKVLQQTVIQLVGGGGGGHSKKNLSSLIPVTVSVQQDTHPPTAMKLSRITSRVQRKFQTLSLSPLSEISAFTDMFPAAHSHGLSHELKRKACVVLMGKT